MIKTGKGNPKIYYVGYDGTLNYVPVVAVNRTQALQKFADFEGLRGTSYLSTKTDKSVSEAIRRMKPIV